MPRFSPTCTTRRNALNHTRPSLHLIVLAALALSACESDSGGSAGSGDSSDMAPPVAAFTASDYAYDGPASLPAGITEISMTNAGAEPHMIQIVGIPDDMTMEQVGMAMADIEAEVPEWAVFAGGPNGADPGGTASAFVNLEPGKYALMCPVPSPDGTAHAAKGMVAELTVTEPDAAAPVAAAPDVAVAVVGKEFAYGMPDESLAAGEHVFSLKNEGAQPHEATLVKLDEGATAMDILAAFSPDAQGPPPGSFVGGVGVLAPGASQSFPATLDSGHYAFMCFYPDSDTGTPHLALGMSHEFDVP
jgi:uncharacterized cupredoxin-like copper-binding protein